MGSTPSINEHQTDESELVYALRERIKDLQSALGADWRAPRKVKLTPKENEVLAIIVSQPMVSATAIYNILYGQRPDPPYPHILNVLVAKIRAKLRPHGISIENVYSVGYWITPENLALLNALYAPGERPILEGEEL